VTISPTQQREILRIILSAKYQQLLAIEQELNARRFVADDGVSEGTILQEINDCFIERKGVKARLDAIMGAGQIPFPTDDEITKLSAAVRRLDHVRLSTTATRALIDASQGLISTFP
jgi:hypothetical protein